MSKQTLQQDMNDIMELYGSELRRYPCGHLWHKDYVCICGVDHDAEAYDVRTKIKQTAIGAEQEAK